MLRYSKPLNDTVEIPGTATQHGAFMEAFRHYNADALEVFAGLVPRNREGHVFDRAPQPYLCVGCDVGNGYMRSRILGFAAYPLYRAAIRELTGVQLALQCYFAQTYEPQAGPGPGGIIGTLPPKVINTLDTTAARAMKYWQWVDNESVGSYLPEAEAETALWKLSYIGFSRGKAWLMALPDDLPPEGVGFPADLHHDLHALLGVAAMQKLIARHLGRDFVLRDAGHVILREHLNWGSIPL